MLIGFAERNYLKITNTFFYCKASRKWTWKTVKLRMKLTSFLLQQPTHFVIFVSVIRRAAYCSMDFPFLLALSLYLIGFIFINFYSHVVYRKSRKVEKKRRIQEWHKSLSWSESYEVSDICKVKSKLTEHALKYSVDGYSSKSGSVGACKHMKVGSRGGVRWSCLSVVLILISQEACEDI